MSKPTPTKLDYIHGSSDEVGQLRYPMTPLDTAQGFSNYVGICNWYANSMVSNYVNLYTGGHLDGGNENGLF